MLIEPISVNKKFFASYHQKKTQKYKGKCVSNKKTYVNLFFYS
jgi:hypothetical protein